MSRVLRYVAAAAIGLFVASLILSLQGYSAGAFLEVLRMATIGSPYAFLDVLRWTTPLLLSGLAFLIAARVGYFNLGVEGQIYVGSLFSALISHLLPLPPVLAILAGIVAGIAGGVLWALPCAWLAKRWGVNEVVTTLMLNYVAVLLCTFFVKQFFLAKVAGGGTIQTITTDKIEANAELPVFTPFSGLNLGLLLALIVAAVAAFVLMRTRTGYELSAVGEGPRFSQFSGIPVHKRRFQAFLVSGAVAGLAGAIETQGVLHSFIAGSLDNMGFNGMLVSLVAMNNPIGLAASAFFFGILQNSQLVISQATTVSSYLVTVVSALFILAFAANPTRFLVDTWRARRER
ncbi:ABC transporter permease [Actinoplanes bogorensis]|uniref:ABC transporter permease n=1 Tax=Paractinoplanes bogorensis TaxID=1610840 RepID=A0ABS5YJX2_9ACTN|nr:ABC transporter permease [Actinoplanes bogorensis]MBU2663777.1 ABC transporter permease [Actinoplanes bogorensis]